MGRHPMQLVASGTAAMPQHRPAWLDLPTTAAVGGLAGAVGASALWLMLVFRDYDQGLEAWGTVNELWFGAFMLAWLAGLGLSVAPRCLRRPLGRPCRRLSLVGMMLSGLLVAVSPGEAHQMAAVRARSLWSMRAATPGRVRPRWR